MSLLVIPWDFDPIIFSIGSFSLRWYGLLFASSFFFGYLIMRKMFLNENLKEELLDKLTIYTVFGTILGARLGHCFFYEPAYYLANPGEILMIWHGGLASHGAAIGILIAIWIFTKSSYRSFLWTLDRLVVVVALAGFFIRMGNLVNSEIYGVETTLPWGFVFLQNGETAPKHPTQIYEALAYLAIFFLLFRIYWSKKGKVREGLLFGLFLVLVFAFRFFIEYIKEDQVAFEAGMNLNMGQWLSIPLILAGVGLLVYSYRKKEKVA